MPEWTFTIAEIRSAAQALWQAARERRVLAFYGPMGAGKTTFIHALCDVIQVSSTVGSPTFPIINEYSYPGGILYHIDLYRLKDEEEAIRAGVEDCLYSGHICLVEWPGRAETLFPPDTMHIYIEPINKDTRHIRVEDN